jgi:hypothetical protein
MAETPISATQKRVAELLSLDTDGTYVHASHVLAAAGLPSDGVPSGHTWRSVKKLSDAEFRTLLTPDAEIAVRVGTYESAADRNRRLADEAHDARKAAGARTLAWQRGETDRPIAEIAGGLLWEVE